MIEDPGPLLSQRQPLGVPEKDGIDEGPDGRGDWRLRTPISETLLSLPYLLLQRSADLVDSFLSLSNLFSPLLSS